MTTLGYGDITAQNTGERSFAIVAMLFGAIIFGYVIGNITSLVNSQHSAHVKKSEIRTECKEFCKSHKLTPGTSSASLFSLFATLFCYFSFFLFLKLTQIVYDSLSLLHYLRLSLFRADVEG
jgi:hypothetical protein